MFKWLRDEKILQKNNIPYQVYNKYFKVTHKYVENIGKTKPIVLINKNGVVYLHSKLAKEGYIILKSVEEIIEELNKSNK